LSELIQKQGIAQKKTYNIQHTIHGESLKSGIDMNCVTNQKNAVLKTVVIVKTMFLYNACNDKYNLHVTEYIYHLYYRWQRCMYKIHKSGYYNVRLHKFIWINGTALNQLEEVKPEVTVMDFGILTVQVAAR
jgi:hypothetical protein